MSQQQQQQRLNSAPPKFKEPSALTPNDVFNSTARFVDNANKFNFDISSISTVHGHEFHNDFVTTTRNCQKSTGDAPIPHRKRHTLTNLMLKLKIKGSSI